MSVKELVDLSRVRNLAGSGLAKEIRVRAGLSQNEVATALGVNRSTVHRWESGRCVPRGRPALAYSELLEGLLSK